MPFDPNSDRSEIRAGVIYASAAFAFWGFLPLYFKAVEAASPIEVLVHRVVWAAPAVAIWVSWDKRWGRVREAFASRKTLLILGVTASILIGNWLTYVWAVANERVLEGALGYFINPLVSVALGVVLLGERLRPAQALAIGLATLAVINQTVQLGALPWVSLVLAGSFALYGLLRKTVNADARTGLMVETAIMWPLGVIGLTVIVLAGVGVTPSASPGMLALLAAAGPVTALPLALFALGAKRLTLTTIGLLQYIGPTLQAVLAIAFGEAFTFAHAVTFGLIGLGLAVFSADAWAEERRLARLA